VLTHAFLEDFLRTLAETFLPYADEQILNSIPLAGLDGRADKFPLGKLAQHRGKSVESVIRESVRQHLKKSTYNNLQEIISLLEKLGFDASGQKENFSKIAAMIKRRHQIVHHGDMVKKEASKTLTVVRVNVFEVIEWVQATSDFMYALFPSVAHRKIDLQLERKVMRAKTRKIIRLR